MAFLWAAAISAGGSILGSLFGKSKPTVISSGQQLKSTVKAARELGIHPLAAIGSGAQYTAIPAYNNPIGPAVSKAADTIAKIPQQRMDKEITASQIEVNKAQAEVLRQQGTQIQTEVAANLRNGTTGARNVSNPEKPPELFTTVTGEKGQKIRVPDMQVAPDLETTISAQIENGTVMAWLDAAIKRNDPRIPLIKEYLLNPKIAKPLRDKVKALFKKKAPHDAGLYTP